MYELMHESDLSDPRSQICDDLRLGARRNAELATEFDWDLTAQPFLHPQPPFFAIGSAIEEEGAQLFFGSGVSRGRDMTDSMTRAIEEQLECYLQGEQSPWILKLPPPPPPPPPRWGPRSDRVAHELATSITLRIAEFTSGDWSEEELRAALSDLSHPTLSPLILSSETFTYSGGSKGEKAVRGFSSHLAKFAVVGTGRSEVVA